MHPVLKRILLNGAFTAAILALVGVLFAELAGMWVVGSARPGAPNLNPPLEASLRYRVPLTMAGAGFLFVALSELLLWAVRGEKKPLTKSAEVQPDEAEKLLNELLAQAEAKMASEAETQRAASQERETATSERKAE